LVCTVKVADAPTPATSNAETVWDLGVAEAGTENAAENFPLPPGGGGVDRGGVEGDG
jgi:hypothetical protein